MIRVMTAAVSGATALVVARHARTTASRDRLRFLAERAPFRVPSVVRAPLERSLRRAAIDSSPQVVLRLWILTVVVVVLVVATVSIQLVPFAAPVALLAPVVGFRIATRRADRRAEAALPDVLRAIASDLRTGSTLAQSVERVANSESALCADFRRIGARIRLGASVETAVRPWSAERPIPGVDVVAAALSCVDTAGGPAARALDGLARSLSDRLAVADEQRAQAAQARVSAIVVGVAPVAYVLFAAVVDAGSIAALLGRPLGRVCLAVGLALDGLAIVWMRRIVRDPEVGW
jgi:tight adherence protein B